MRNLAPFAMGSIIRKLNNIHCQISNRPNRPFPKPEAFQLSKYIYKRRYIRIHDDGRIEGELSRFVSSLVDFLFIRSIVAHRYSLTGIAHLKNEGRHFISNKNQILHHHGKGSNIHLADAKYDEILNYEFSHSQGAIPIIDYNPRSENLSLQVLKTRGYDHKGRPYAPCGLLTRPNGFDQKCQRASALLPSSLCQLK